MIAERLMVDAELLARFREYKHRHPAWGALHVVLEDGNIGLSSCVFARGEAERADDLEGAQLAAILCELTKSQRLKIARLA